MDARDDSDAPAQKRVDENTVYLSRANMKNDGMYKPFLEWPINENANRHQEIDHLGWTGGNAPNCKDHELERE